MKYEAINLAEKFKLFDEAWQPRVIAELNDYQFKLVRLDGEFVWHKHDETDEAFLVLSGELTIELRDGAVKMKAGDLYVVPRGVEHKPTSPDECQVLLIEPRGVANTGDTGGDRTAREDVWI
ncbi:MAG: cupin domain-containing protein [Gammaproteobacteria bacterium]|nr:cupin domain-containing protein [Gammaproteobacteria bacterium]NNE05172.1 cupin domain-containing protein [Xanthomonadales bacterium]